MQGKCPTHASPPHQDWGPPGKRERPCLPWCPQPAPAHPLTLAAPLAAGGGGREPAGRTARRPRARLLSRLPARGHERPAWGSGTEPGPSACGLGPCPLGRLPGPFQPVPSALFSPSGPTIFRRETPSQVIERPLLAPHSPALRGGGLRAYPELASPANPCRQRRVASSLCALGPLPRGRGKSLSHTLRFPSQLWAVSGESHSAGLQGRPLPAQAPVYTRSVGADGFEKHLSM